MPSVISNRKVRSRSRSPSHSKPTHLPPPPFMKKRAKPSNGPESESESSPSGRRPLASVQEVDLVQQSDSLPPLEQDNDEQQPPPSSSSLSENTSFYEDGTQESIQFNQEAELEDIENIEPTQPLPVSRSDTIPMNTVTIEGTSDDPAVRAFLAETQGVDGTGGSTTVATQALSLNNPLLAEKKRQQEQLIVRPDTTVIVPNVDVDVDVSQLLAKRLGYASMYWSNLKTWYGTRLGVYVKAVDLPDSEQGYCDQVMIGRRLNQQFANISDRNGGPWIGMPLTRGISFFKGPPFGNIGVPDSKVKPTRGLYKSAKCGGAISMSHNALPGDLCWDNLNEDGIPIPRLYIAKQWLSEAIEMPAIQSWRALYPLNAAMPWKTLVDEAVLFWSSRLYVKSNPKSNSRVLYTKAFIAKDTPADERLKLQQQLTWTKCQRDEGCAKEFILRSLPMYRLPMKGDTQQTGLIPMYDWKQQHASVLDYNNDIFQEFVCPGTVNPNKKKDQLHMNWALQGCIWFGKSEWFNFDLLDKNQPEHYNVTGFVQHMIETISNHEPPIPLTLEEGWSLRTDEDQLDKSKQEEAAYLRALHATDN